MTRPHALYDRDGKEITKLEGHTAEVWAAKFSPDGVRIVTASKDRTARLWSSEGKLVKVLQDHTDIPLVSFSPDGSTLLTIDDKVARLWDKSGKMIGVIECRYAEFSPDSRHIVTMTGKQIALVYLVPIARSDTYNDNSCNVARDHFGSLDCYPATTSRSGN